MQKQQLVLLLCATLVSVGVSAADTQAGKAASQKCIQCHEADDWEGEDAASLESLIKDIIAGKVKHKTRIDLTPAEVANIAAYWETGGK